MLVELVITLIIGLICIWMGLLIWKNGKIELIHSYHYANVSEEDKEPYTKLMGKGLCLIGVGCILTGVIDYITKTAYGWICFALFFMVGYIFIMGKAQKKYNGGWF